MPDLIDRIKSVLPRLDPSWLKKNWDERPGRIAEDLETLESDLTKLIGRSPEGEFAPRQTALKAIIGNLNSPSVQRLAGFNTDNWTTSEYDKNSLSENTDAAMEAAQQSAYDELSDRIYAAGDTLNLVIVQVQDLLKTLPTRT